jgi:hypothetical protein
VEVHEIRHGPELGHDALPPGQLRRGMHFPVGWDPYFRDWVTMADVLHYATQHYDHYRAHLTLASAAAP